MSCVISRIHMMAHYTSWAWGCFTRISRGSMSLRTLARSVGKLQAFDEPSCTTSESVRWDDHSAWDDGRRSIVAHDLRFPQQVPWPNPKEHCSTHDFRILVFIMNENLYTAIFLQEEVSWEIFIVYCHLGESSGSKLWQPGATDAPRLTGLAPVGINYRKWLQDRTLFEAFRQ